MQYDLEKMVLEILERHLPTPPQKDRFTPEDIAERYGTSVATAHRMMNNGDFGEIINITARNKVVTLEGLLKYEASHTGFVSGKPVAGSRRSKAAKAAVGRI